MSQAPVTEICYITIKPGLDIDGDTPARKVLRDSFITASEQEGFEGYYYGKQRELFPEIDASMVVRIDVGLRDVGQITC